MTKLVFAAALLAAGIVPYVLWQQDVLFLRPLAGWLPEEIPFAGTLPERFFRYHFADIVWYAALLLLQYLLARGTATPLTYAIYALPFVCEAAQSAGLMPGTFDLLDLLFYLITLMIFLIWKRKRN